MYSNTVKKAASLILFVLILTSCNGWSIQPLPYNPPTPFSLPTHTPSIYSPTPVIIGATNASSTPVMITNTNTPFSTSVEIPTSTFTPTSPAYAPALQIIVIGCNTSIDITHGMGEVTNAYVTLKNIGNVELLSLTVSLYALDEGREHPDKTQEVPSIPVQFQITLKLTVDSTYKEESPIQVEVNSAQGLFPREGLASCRDIGLFAPQPDELGKLTQSNP